MATLRGLTVVGEQIQRLGWDRPGETPELVDRAEQMVFDLAQHRIRGSFERVDELVRQSFEQITKMYESGGEMTGTPTGFRDIDHMTSGLQPGNLIIVAGRPSMGKSAFALGMASNLGLHHGIPVAVFTLEMSKLEVAQRLMCSEARVELQRLRTGRLTNDDWPRLVKACDSLTKAPIYVDDTRLTTMLEIRAKARRLKAREPNLGLIVIDYLQLMSGGSIENRVQEVSQISRSLKMIAGDLEVPVVALSQLSRAVESRTDKRPLLSDLRESGSDRAGRRPRHVPLPRRVLQRAVGGSGPRRGDPREAPQRPDRHREARLPQALREVRRPRPAARRTGGRMSGRATTAGRRRQLRRPLPAPSLRASSSPRPRRRATTSFPGPLPSGGAAQLPRTPSRAVRRRNERCTRSGRRRCAAERTASGSHRAQPTSRASASTASNVARGEGGSFLAAVRAASVRGRLPTETDVGFIHCAAGHELVVRRVDRPSTLARPDARQLQLT